MWEGPPTPRRYPEGGAARGKTPQHGEVAPRLPDDFQCRKQGRCVGVGKSVQVSQCPGVWVQLWARGLCGLSPELWAEVLRPSPALRLLLQLGPGARPLPTFRQPPCGVRGCRTSESPQGPPVTLAGASRSEPSQLGPHTGTAQCPLVKGVECLHWVLP